MNYFTKIESVHVPKNKLEKAVQDYIKKYNRLILNDSDFEDVKKVIEEEVRRLNIENSRCKPIFPNFYSPPALQEYQREPDIFFNGGDCIYLAFYSVRRLFLKKRNEPAVNKHND